MKFEDVPPACMRVLAEGLYDLGSCPARVDEAMDQDAWSTAAGPCTASATCSASTCTTAPRARKELYRDGVLGAGYVLTVEPGLYFQPEDELVPAELRGIGVRIEDDVLVTADRCAQPVRGLPRSADDVESWLAAQREAGPRLPG